MIREACHEVQRPVFYAIAIIITAYMPIFTLQRVEGRLFRPMAWTVAFALLGAMTFSILIAPVLCSHVLQQGSQGMAQPGHGVSDEALPRRRCAGPSNTAGSPSASDWLRSLVALYLTFSGIIGAEFLPHLDEGAIWARGALANSTSLTEGERFTTQCRYIFASFPEVTTVVSQAGAPDDGTDTGGFGNTEYFVDLKPKEQWRPVFHQNKEELIAAMNRELEKYPGAFWNFSQPIEDNVDETMTGTKGGLAPSFTGRTWTFSSKRAKRSRKSWPILTGSRIWGFNAIRASRISISPLTVKRQRALASMWRIYKTPSKRPSAVFLSARSCRERQSTTWSCAIRNRIAIPRRPSRIFACSPPQASASRWLR